MSKIPARELAVLEYIAQRLASGERLTPARDGITTASEAAANACDLAVDRIAQLQEHGPDAPVSPRRIGVPR